MSGTTLEAPATDTKPQLIPHDHSYLVTPEEVVIDDPHFSARELESFREEDAEAGRRICTIMSSLFTISVIQAAIVITWTFGFAVN